MVNFVFGSASISRLELLRKINFTPSLVVWTSIDETPQKKEKPLDYVRRMAKTKAETLNEKYYGSIILCTDTIVYYQTRIFKKPVYKEEMVEFLNFYSSKNIKVATSLYLIGVNHNRSQKVVETTLKFKHLHLTDIEEYIKCDQWKDKAGGIAIETLMDSFVIRIIGSYSNIIGLPLYETRNILISAGVERINSK